MLEVSRGLSPRVLEEIAKLEQRTVSVDGGRLKLEWGVLRSRSADEINDVLWWDGPQLLGFAGLYCFDGHHAELAGMVDPSARRRGIASALLDAALLLCRERSYANVLLVVPRQSEGGHRIAAGRQATLHHSEHALILTAAPVELPAQHDLSIRTAEPADVGSVTRLLVDAFGGAPDDIAERLVEDASSTLVIESEGVAIGTLRVTRDGNAGGIYGFAVDPPLQGRGIGRAVLSRVCRELFEDGIEHIGLEVVTENEHALGLYTSLGFTLVTTEDYYSLAL